MERVFLPRRRGTVIRAGTIIRPYAPSGFYWHDDLSMPGALYMNREDIIITACHFNEEEHDGDYYSEFDDPIVEEIRLLASLILPLGLDDGMIVPYPLSHSQRFVSKENLSHFDISSDTFEYFNSIFQNRYEVWKNGCLPPLFGGGKYQYLEERSPTSLQERLFASIDSADSLLIRGLSTLLKSAMLAQHPPFFESAIYTLYISLDASFSLVIRRLRATGVSAPNAYDAGDFIENLFGDSPTGRRYFEEYYDDRIKTMHPSSRFGEFPYAPVSHDDFYFLYKGLREVYRYLILEKVIDRPLAESS